MKDLCPHCKSPGLYRDLTEIACMYCGERIYPGVPAINDRKPERADKGVARREYRRRTKKANRGAVTHWVA